jgi:hypothetical protein
LAPLARGFLFGRLRTRDTHNDLETKAAIPLDAVVTHGEMMRAFEAFKDAND